ncbi:MAG: hypothetical protein ACI4DO_02685 [Roseburia sp.]
MSNPGLEFSTAVNWYQIGQALDYGKAHLNQETFQKVEKAFKTMVIHILLWILIAVAVGGAIIVISKYVSDTEEKNLLDSYNATHWVSGVRVDSTTVQYTRGESYRFDVTALGVNLDTDFPNQRSFTLLLDDTNTLKGVISNDEFLKAKDIFAIGIVMGMVVAIVILVAYAILCRKCAPYAKVWYGFMRWVNTGDESFLQEI